MSAPAGRNGAELLVDALIAWGVDTIFGMPGDGINGVMEAIRAARRTVRFIQVRHEESAALMACAHSKWTGRIGCCLATTGPGGMHLLNGLYDAKFDKAPGDRDDRTAVSRSHRHVHAAGCRPAASCSPTSPPTARAS